MDSFEQAERWLADIKINLPRAPVWLVGNKIDLNEDRKVEDSVIQELVKQQNLKFVETSAKTGVGIEELFLGLASDALLALRSSTSDGSLPQSLFQPRRSVSQPDNVELNPKKPKSKGNRRRSNTGCCLM